MALKIHHLEKRKAQRRKQRNRRRLQRWWQNSRPKFLLVLAVTLVLLCVTGPAVFSHLRTRVNHTILPIRTRLVEARKARQRLQQRRPAAEDYRNEKLVAAEDGWLLKGDCLRQHQWHAFWVYDDGRTVVSQFRE